MAIVQISRISHRTGVSENLPQLARGEVGLSVDTRQVYIGNGGDDAPKIENIELLTSLSDVVSLANTYTYSDSQIGFSAQTGSDPAFPVKRALQDKLDDFASVRDFGAKGDNTTDDTDAINRALYELFAVEQQPQVRRSLYFPAGVYKVSSEIKIPSYAVLTGEGPESTIISSSATTGTVAVTADSLQQVSVSIGSNGATQPSYIVCNSMSFTAEQDIDTFTIDQANTVVFNDCVFTGNKSILPTGIDNSKSCVTISSSPAYISKHIVFKSCVFKNHTFGFNLNNDIHSVLIDGCRFDTLFKGMKCGETITGSSPSVKGPSSVKITSSVFDKIYNKGIHVFNSGFVSAFNYFLDVGNSGAGVGNATDDVITFTGTGCYSYGDYFERLSSEVQAGFKKINHGDYNIITQDDQFEVGSYVREAQSSITLDNNTTDTTGVTFNDNNNYYAIEIDYYISRNSKLRQGTLRITHDSTSQQIDDDFSENNGSVGVVFSLTNVSNITTLNYTTDNQTSGTMKLTTRIIR